MIIKLLFTVFLTYALAEDNTRLDLPTPKTILQDAYYNPMNSEVGEWNSTCIKIKFTANLNFTYTTKENKTKNIIYNLPSKDMEKTDDDCNTFNQTQHISLGWQNQTDSKKYQNNIVFNFGKSADSFYLNIISISLVPVSIFDDANNDSVQLLYEGKMKFKTPLKMSYHCTKEQQFNLTSTLDDPTNIGILMLSNLQFEAFYSSNNKDDKWVFSNAKDCEASVTPDIVPIAVGIALSALILIVLITYLVARRRSANSGYMSF